MVFAFNSILSHNTHYSRSLLLRYGEIDLRATPLCFKYPQNYITANKRALTSLQEYYSLNRANPCSRVAFNPNNIAITICPGFIPRMIKEKSIVIWEPQNFWHFHLADISRSVTTEKGCFKVCLITSQNKTLRSRPIAWKKLPSVCQYMNRQFYKKVLIGKHNHMCLSSLSEDTRSDAFGFSHSYLYVSKIGKYREV